MVRGLWWQVLIQGFNSALLWSTRKILCPVSLLCTSWTKVQTVLKANITCPQRFPVGSQNYLLLWSTQWFSNPASSKRYGNHWCYLMDLSWVWETGNTELKIISLLCHCWPGWIYNGKSQTIFILQQMPVGSLQISWLLAQIVSAWSCLCAACHLWHCWSVWVWDWS